MQVLLQYSSLPYTHTMLWHKPGVLYAAVSLLLENGADPNALTSSSEVCMSVQTDLHYVKKLQTEQRKM